jgi:2-phospho-L-lactate transferase/gluconeogenesis factor (CofD/UPF0052 family)
MAAFTHGEGLQLDAENRACLFLKAALLFSKGSHSEALRTIESLLQIDPHLHQASPLTIRSSEKQVRATCRASRSRRIRRPVDLDC